MAKSNLSRREFIRFAGLATGAAVLGACAPQVVTQVVKETQIVNQTQEVVQTQVVEVPVDVLVTATPEPAITTPQGRELPADAAPLEKQVFREMGAEPKHFDTARDIYSSGATNLGNEPLLRNNENIETVPALAESWTAGPNAEYWEFVIHEDAKWSDGEPITADDIVYTYKHLADPALGNPWVWFYADIKGVAKFNAGTGSAADIGVVKVDDRTVQIYGEYGSIPYLPALLSYQAAVIVPQHVAEANPEHWADSVEGFVSGGPYIPTVWEHNKRIEWEINPEYNGPHKPGIQKVVNPLLAAGAPDFTPWLNKESELVHVLTPQDVAAVRTDPNLNKYLHFFNNFQSTYVALDTFKPPLDNLDFRKALAHAVDRDTLCQQVLNGTYVAGYSMLPPGFPAYNPELKSLQVFDLEQAQASLAASGIDPASVTLELYSNGRDQFLEFVKQQWETNLGIKVNLNQLEGGVWGQMRADHAMQAYRGPYEYDFVDPSNMLTGLFRSQPAPEGKSEPWGSPRHPWKSQEFDDLVTEAGSEADVAKRIQEFQDAEKILAGDVGVVFLAHQIVFQIWWPWLVGMHPDKTGNVVFRWLDIARFQMYIHKDVDTLMETA
ncbi:MAG: twin-arginine translocation signal domain-containing protein [Anaerolineales bacterium]|nr:twin-arginine translocation signal domain-containing protein [Anaerolineales bacterium]